MERDELKGILKLFRQRVEASATLAKNSLNSAYYLVHKVRLGDVGPDGRGNMPHESAQKLNEAQEFIWNAIGYLQEILDEAFDEFTLEVEEEEDE